ncbi:MAG: methylmalonyl-CoA mutase family protein [candidate division KSB1 bacterium]|nr:methylmalonyl-CoA mutase family protein [candidate division KSB1 bacterium]MDZ7318336.1 methylmalonyl-CoA mutase family protein [candidate division KSB1 bacterium]MDZ7342179.1 methylmalonyl-CoA mutase family protein [candidate division KSB1 bacterium]
MNKTELKDEIHQELHRWQESVLKPTTAKFVERKTRFVTGSSDPIEPLYTPCDIENLNYLDDLGFPAEFPFTRGIQPNMYRGRLWTMRQYAGFGTARETNARFKFLLQQGQTGLSVAFDLPTQIGYDSDHPISRGEVGKVGVAIDTLADMELLFDGIPLDKVSTSMTINAPAAILLAMYLAVAEKQGVPRQQLMGTIQNDILKEYVARGTYIFPPTPSLRLITDIFTFCASEMPQWNPISISGYHIREAGATAAQEIGFTLANGIAYVQAAIDAGLKVDQFAGRMSFFFNAHNDLLEEVAKFRAARRLWAKIMKHRFQAQHEKSMMLRFHTQTGGSTLTAQQPYNNIIRVTIQALAAVLGGTQSLHTNSYDEALALPTEEAATIALRTQQIIAYESGVAETVDPLAGSYFIESKTNQLETAAQKYIADIDALGGVVRAIEKGYIQREIQQAAYRHLKEIEANERIIVGVNKFKTAQDRKPELLKVDQRTQDEQLERLRLIKQQRDHGRVQQQLAQLKQVASSSENLMPAILSAVKSYATLGEICDVLRHVFGEYQETVF